MEQPLAAAESHQYIIVMSVGGFIVISIILAAYMAPWLIACKRHHTQRNQIGVLNALFGWTPIGWAAAFTWACTDNVEPRPVYREQREPILMPEVSRPWLITIGVVALVIFILC